jgi:hypothetical protein
VPGGAFAVVTRRLFAFRGGNPQIGRATPATGPAPTGRGSSESSLPEKCARI